MKNQINNFYLEFNTYIDYNKKEEIKDKYEHVYYYIKKKKFKNKYQRKFKKNYKHLEKYVEKYNKIYIEKNLNIDILNNVNGCSLDNNQKKAILTDEINNLVIAGAGSGKTLTIIGKIMYLIEIQNVHPKDILCISFTFLTVSTFSTGFFTPCSSLLAPRSSSICGAIWMVSV